MPQNNNLPLEMLRRCKPGILPYLRTPDGHPEFQYYGLGDSPNWSTQCTAKAFGAFAELAANGDESSLSIALNLLHYLLETHKSGSFHGVDGLQWGNTWISSLALERVLFAAESIAEQLTSADSSALRRVILHEAEYLMTHPITAAIDAETKKNRPEANIWNGGMLLRAALKFPEVPRAKEYFSRGLEFFVNGICLPGDTDPRLHGANFTENYGLNHHCYLNVGYMVICLSHIAITHFMFKDHGKTAPDEVYQHAADLWIVVKSFMFSDGRLFRIGGDTRIRYAYCQLYLPLIALWAEDYLGDSEAPDILEKSLLLLKKDQDASGGTRFFGKRLGHLEHDSYQYYCRLESDAFAMLAFTAHYLNRPEKKAMPQPARLSAWSDEFHGAGFLRTPRSFRSWCAKGADGPLALCVPPDSSNIAEWQHQLTGEFITPAPSVAQPVRQTIRMLKDSFVACSENVRIASPYAEGEEINTFARQQFAVAALPDGVTLIVLEYSNVLREITFDRISGINWKVPNDLFNGNRRSYDSGSFHLEINNSVPADEVTDTGSGRLTADNRLSLFLLYGADTLKIRRFARRNVTTFRFPFLSSLYADVIGFEAAPRRARAGEVLLDTGCAVSAVNAAEAGKIRFRKLDMPGLCRGVEFFSCNGVKYRFTANFGDAALDGLEAGSARLDVL